MNKQNKQLILATTYEIFVVLKFLKQFKKTMI